MSVWVVDSAGCCSARRKLFWIDKVYLVFQGLPSEDFYVTTNGRVSGPAELLLQGSVYHLEPRLCGGKGGEALAQTHTRVGD